MDTNYTRVKNHGPLATYVFSSHSHDLSHFNFGNSSTFLSEYVQLQYVEVFQFILFKSLQRII
jgi:hypothetical protein